MPGYRAHVFGGALIAGGALGLLAWAGMYAASLEHVLVLVCIAALAALFPDVDTDSKGQHLFYGALFVIDLGLIVTERYFWAALLGLFAMLPAIGRHRGWTHTWWAMLLVPLPLLLLPAYVFGAQWQAFAPYYLSAVTCFGSHLLLHGVFKC